MYLPLDWLGEYVDLSDHPRTLARDLTQLGLEVEEVFNPADQLENLRIVELESIEPHPHNHQLNLVKIYDGSQKKQVITAASNLSPDKHYPWAPPGSCLRGETVKSQTFEKIESQGMLCSLEELGLTASSTGLLELSSEAPLGTPAVDLLHLDQPIFVLDVTPNRSDCLSLVGVARDYAAAKQKSLRLPDPPELNPTGDCSVSVEITAPQRCFKYFGLEIDNVPLRSSINIQRRLVQVGLQPRNLAVDATNYVLFEQGNPLHAFDANRLRGDITVRLGEATETLETIDGTSIDLTPEDLVIADSQGPRALAGLIGGASSAVSADTNRILVEGAYFTPNGIRRTSQHHNLRTASSYRFERGVDPGNVMNAMERYVQLLSSNSDLDLILKGPANTVVQSPESPSVAFHPKKYSRLVGESLNKELMKSSFKSLGCRIDDNDDNKEVWKLIPPTWRHDLRREEDFVEELLRLSGYTEISSNFPSIPLDESPAPEVSKTQFIRRTLSTWGFNEAITFSFHSRDNQRLSNGTSSMTVANPLSDEHEVLRRSLIDSLLPALERNVEAGAESVKLFETGRVFKSSSSREPTHVALLASGAFNREKWDSYHRPFDFYDLKGIIKLLLEQCGYNELNFRPIKRDGFVSSHTAEVSYMNTRLGCLGKIKPDILRVKLDESCWGAEINLSQLPEAPAVEFSSFSREPYVKRDLDLVVDGNLYAGELRQTIEDAGRWIERIEIFDVYRGDPLPSDQKSVSFRLYFRASNRTLSDEEVNEVQETILDRLRDDYGAGLRDE